MVNSKKVIVCDLDGTLTPSKSPLTPDMAEVLCKLLSRHFLAVVSGGSYAQYQKQFLGHLSCPPESLQNLFLFPTNGSACYTYDLPFASWKQQYIEVIPEIDRKKIIAALEKAIAVSGLDLSGAFGEIIEDRESQITFSGRGQEAPVEEKQMWDPDKSKRQKIVELIQNELQDFEIRTNAMSSIDITKKGIDKAYAIGKIKEIMHVSDEDIIFIGDALFPGGNDAAVKKTPVDFIQPDDPKATIEIFRAYL